MTRGLMILISSCEIEKTEVVQTYYLRQTVEVMFGFSKDDLGLLPLRVHSEKHLGVKYTVEEVLIQMRNLKCYPKEIIVSELTKRQKEIIEKLEILMPKNSGI